MKKLLAITLTAALVLSFGNSVFAASSESSAPAAEVTVSADGPSFNLKFASTENEGTLRYQMLEKPIMDLITEKTNGRITFTFFPSSSLVGSGAVIKGCQDGTCDIGMDNINSYPGVFLYSELMTTPGVLFGNDFDSKAESIKTYCDAYATQEYKDNGIYLIGTAPAPCVIEPPIKAIVVSSPLLAFFKALLSLALFPFDIKDFATIALYSSDSKSTGNSSSGSGTVKPSFK